MAWHDFPLEISGPRGAARARVLTPQPTGEMAASDAEPIAVAPEVDALVPKLERRKASPDQVFELGRLLGSALMPGRVRELFESTRRALGEDVGVRVRLSIEDTGLAALPWEYAHVARTPGDPQPADFLALASGVSLVRHTVTGAPLAAIADKAALRVVLAIAAPDDLPVLDLERDRTAIEEALARVDGDTGAVELKVVQPATRATLALALRDADAFHFAGHGSFGVTGFSDGGSERTGGRIMLEDANGSSDPLSGDELAVMLAGAGTRLVVLGACESGARDERGPWSGVGPALVRNDVPAVVAMQSKVVDRNASRFMAPFYVAVLGGASVDQAVADGRRAVFLDGGVVERDWGVPVLYTRTEDGVLFPAPAATVGARSPVLRVRQRIYTVYGEVIGVRAKYLGPGAPDIDVSQVFGSVKRGAKVIGADFDVLGGDYLAKEE